MIQRGHLQIYGAILVLAALLTFANDQYNVDRQVANQRIERLESEVEALSNAQSQTSQRLDAIETRQAQAATTPAPQASKRKQTSFGDYVREFFGDGIPLGGE